MRNQRYRIFVVCSAMALSLLAPSLTMAQDALDKFGDSVFGRQNVEKYATDLSRIGEELRSRETGSQQASQTALTFLNLLRTARSDQEWSILSSLRPNFNAAWKYLIETGSSVGQQLQASTFGKERPEIYGQSMKIVTDPGAAAEYAVGEALVVGPYGRSAGEIFRIWQSGRNIGDDDLRRLADASKSGVIEKVEKMENKELLADTGAMFDIVVGLGTIGGDIIAAAKKGASWKSRVVSILSVSGGVTQVADGLKKLGG